MLRSQRLVAEVLLHSGVNRRTAAALLKDMKALRRVAESEALRDAIQIFHCICHCSIETPILWM